MARAKKTKPGTVPYWKTWQFWAKIIAIIGPTIALLNYLNGLGYFPSKKEIEPEKMEQPDPGCGFPAHFVRDTLYVLITRFEDFENENDTECYGRNIERRIDALVQSHKLPIQFCYRDDLLPNQSLDADRIRDEFHADIIIWGKLRNAGPNCKSDGFCLQFNPSDSFIHHIGREISTPQTNDYQRNISSFDIEQGQIRMGAEMFDDWLIGMFNLKIRQQNPRLFTVAEWWDKNKKTEAYLLRAVLKGTVGDDLAAIADLDQVIMLDPETSQTYNMRGIAKSNLRQWSEALKDFDELIRLEPTLAIGYYNRGTSYTYLEDHKIAITDFTRAIILDSTYALAYNNRGNSKACLGYWEEAILDYNLAIKIDSTNSLFFHNRGFAKFSLQQFSEAINDYNHAIYLNPNYADAYGKRGMAKDGLGNFKEAIRDYNKALILEPNNANNAALYNSRGISKQMRGLLNEAVSDYKKSLSLAANDKTRMNLEFALWEISQNQKEFRRNCALILLLFTPLYLWKFKTINHFLTRAFQSLKKRLRPR
ncbi:MAG: tetratricopeptide repeat protein [Saprospiraceae bacterium]